MNYAINVLVLRLGFGGTAIAWNDIWAQCVVVLLVFGAVHSHLFQDAISARRFYLPVGASLLICAIVAFALRHAFLSAASSPILSVKITGFSLRGIIVMLTWSCVGLVMYRLCGATDTAVSFGVSPNDG